MKFRKRVKIFPGFYLNFSGSGVSSTIGIKGASINFSKKGTYVNTGIPGTGFYNRHRIGNEQENTPLPQEPQIEFNSSLANEIKSADTEQLTSTSLLELKESLHEAYDDRIDINNEIKKVKKEIKSAKNKPDNCVYFYRRFFYKVFKVKNNRERGIFN